MIKNYMEVIVDDLFPTIVDEYMDICKCDKCIDDIKAIALNNLEPIYVVSEKGNMYAKSNELNVQFRTDVIKELTEAIEIVSENPRH
ncbi:late competence development ComFB family protein [Clostridium cochlearium]|uniref:late competence development ComFB family protein n=1 Tax=Clostridium cochlearium TaxID=1494 RepID=UPI000B94AF89|nr:late competence development ComFB family protein [Clostridium cochlearium]MBE6066026.1 competence protein ComFB [Clostridium cochlearium]MCG4571975.1 late competence development ComFB family protein [Clostridium cochlearium]NMA57205.1 late competence development ComFB family protein [Clostridium cochlearium]SNV69081.1 late competence development protein [Clostridium cochlearium]STA91785.1 late competence development protein [Clostridium cochlearium]